MPNIFLQRRVLSLDPTTMRARLGDAAARKSCLAALKEFEATCATLANFDSMRRWPQAVEQLREAGFDVPESSVKVALDKWQEKDRENLKAHVHAQIVRRLADKVAPDLQRCARALAAKLRDDAAELNETCDRIAKRHGADTVRTDLARDLETLAEQLEADASQPVNLAWHSNPRVPLSTNFTEPL